MIAITPQAITSDSTSHHAVPASTADNALLWEISWLPGRYVEVNTAIVAVVLADWISENRHDNDPNRVALAYMKTWAWQLALELDVAIERVTGTRPERAR